MEGCRIGRLYRSEATFDDVTGKADRGVQRQATKQHHLIPLCPFNAITSKDSSGPHWTAQAEAGVCVCEGGYEKFIIISHFIKKDYLRISA